MLRMSYVTVHLLYLSNYLRNSGQLFYLGLRKIVPSIQKLFWPSDEGYKIASWVAPQTRYLKSIHIWRVIRWPLFLFKHLLTVPVEALLRDTCNVRRAPCILLNLPRRLAAVDCTLQWTLWVEINKVLQLLLAATLILKLRHSDVIVVQSWH